MVEWRKVGPLGKAHNIAAHSRLNPQHIKQSCELGDGDLIKKTMQSGEISSTIY